jgi:hypothetical protein
MALGRNRSVVRPRGSDLFTVAAMEFPRLGTLAVKSGNHILGRRRVVRFSVVTHGPVAFSAKIQVLAEE